MINAKHHVAEKYADATYELKTTCGTKEEIPYNVGNLMEPDNPFEQKRIDAVFPVVDKCPVCLDAVPDDINTMFCDATKGKLKLVLIRLSL